MDEFSDMPDVFASDGDTVECARRRMIARANAVEALRIAADLATLADAAFARMVADAYAEACAESQRAYDDYEVATSLKRAA